MTACCCCRPRLYKSTPDGIVEHFEKVAEVGLPIMAYNNPFDTKVDLTPDAGRTAGRDSEVVAVKEFSGDVRRVFEIRELCDIDVIAGADDVLFEMLVDGAVGWFAGYPNAFPKEAVELYDLCCQRKVAGGARAVRTPGRGVPLGLPHRVRPGHQAVDGHLRQLLRRPHPAAAHPADHAAARPGHRGHRTRVGRPGRPLIPHTPGGT